MTRLVNIIMLSLILVGLYLTYSGSKNDWIGIYEISTML